MNIRLLLLVIFCLNAHAGKSPAAELDFGIYEASAQLFTQAEAATLPEGGKADVKAVLKARGFDLPEGSSAYYDAGSGRVFLRSSTRDLRKLQRLVQQLASDEAAASHVKQVRMNAVCYAIPVSALPADFGPQSYIKDLPPGQLTVVDRTALICRGGNQSKVDSRQDAPVHAGAKPAPNSDEAPPPVGERTFEIECFVSDDSAMIDLNVFWEIRSEKLAPPGQTGTFKVAGQILAAPGSTVLQELGVTEEKEPRLVLLALEFHLLPPVAAPEPTPTEDPAK